MIWGICVISSFGGFGWPGLHPCSHFRQTCHHPVDPPIPTLSNDSAPTSLPPFPAQVDHSWLTSPCLLLDSLGLKKLTTTTKKQILAVFLPLGEEGTGRILPTSSSLIWLETLLLSVNSPWFPVTWSPRLSFPSFITFKWIFIEDLLDARKKE